MPEKQWKLNDDYMNVTGYKIVCINEKARE